MRLSQQKPISITAPVKSSADNRGFFEEVIKRLSQEQIRCSVLLVGGADARSIALRRAQAPLRFDRATSYFSHAAMITHPRAGLGTHGVEVNLLTPRPMAQRPAHNGVTRFSLRDYLDTEAFPNLALLSFDEGPQKRAKQQEVAGVVEIEKLMLKALAEPNSDRVRYPLWDQLSSWAAYSYAPDSAPNPLLLGTPHPCAALVEMAFSAAGIDITPGATDNHACPEHLWATFKHWGQRLTESAGLRLSVLAVIRDKAGAMPASGED